MRTRTQRTRLPALLAACPACTAAAALFLVPGVPGFFVAPSPAEALVDAGVLGLVLLAPVLVRVESPRHLWRRRYPLAGVVLGAIAAWDLLTATVVRRRELFSEWRLVYGSGVVTIALLYLLQALLASWVRGLGTGRPESEPPS
ncbi:MAG TPA: hypothetical protein VFQ38_01140 [Longimicrobiales bacterium]|nr:hypothetical protein [Longimicrobiales bacterium]